MGPTFDLPEDVYQAQRWGASVDAPTIDYSDLIVRVQIDRRWARDWILHLMRPINSDGSDPLIGINGTPVTTSAFGQIVGPTTDEARVKIQHGSGGVGARTFWCDWPVQGLAIPLTGNAISVSVRDKASAPGARPAKYSANLVPAAGPVNGAAWQTLPRLTSTLTPLGAGGSYVLNVPPGAVALSILAGTTGTLGYFTSTIQFINGATILNAFNTLNTGFLHSAQNLYQIAPLPVFAGAPQVRFTNTGAAALTFNSFIWIIQP